MTIEQGFKLLDTLGFCRKDIFMFLIRESSQVGGSVVLSDAVEVMNYPSFREWFAISLLPNKDVFKDIVCLSSFMAGLVNGNITMHDTTPTFPSRMVLPFELRKNGPEISRSPSLFRGTAFTTFTAGGARTTAINTIMRPSATPRPSFFSGTTMTPNRLITTNSATINAGMFPCFIPLMLSYLFLALHIYIIMQYWQDCNYITGY